MNGSPKSLWQRLRLSTRLNLVTAAVLFATMAGFVALDYVRERRALLRAKGDELRSIASLAVSTLPTHRPELAKRQLHGLASALSGEAVSLYVVENGSVLVSSSERDLRIRELRKVDWSTDSDAWWTPAGLAVSVPYEAGGTEPATLLFAETSLASIDTTLARTLRMHVLHGLITVAAMALGVAWVLRRAVLHPFTRMMAAMNVMERGTWDIEVPPSYEDEVGALTAAFNRMGKNLTRTALQFARAEKLSALAVLSSRLTKQLSSPLGEIERGASRLGGRPLSLEEVEQETLRIRSAVQRSRDAIENLDEVFFDALEDKEVATVGPE